MMIDRGKFIWLATFILVVVGLSGCAGDGESQPVLQPYEDAGDGDTNGDNGDELDADFDADTDIDADTGPSDAGSDADAGDDQDADNGDDVCQPVGDDTIRRSEFPVETDVSVPYEFALDVDVDINGDENDDGTFVWDLEEIDGDEFVEQLEIKDPDDYWFGDEFPDADYAAKLSVQEDELGVYRVTDEALELIGLATPHGPDSDEDHTHITYDPVIEVLAFPLEEGKSWSTEVEADGEYAEYASYTGHDESYDIEVDAVGEVITPYATFDVLRVYSIRTHPTLRWGWFGPYMTDIQSRVVSYVAECFGTVARILSHEDEEERDFDQAAEVMRLTQ